jgi:hypothetical protein
MSESQKTPKVSKQYYKLRKQDRDQITDTMGNIEAWAVQVAAISSIYTKRCLIGDDTFNLDTQLREITADTIVDLRAAFEKLAKAEEVLDKWLVQNKTSFLGKLLFFT